MCSPRQHETRHRQQFESVNYWYWEHWKFFRNEVKTSIIQGIAVFLSLFDADPDVSRIFCPPKELYEGKRVDSDPKGRVLAPFAELIEENKIVGLNFPVALNPALAKTIGTMMKIDYQRAVQLRIPKMEAETDHHFRATVFICDEYQNFATVGGDNPVGDERFFSISRQPKCIPIVATQSVSSFSMTGIYLRTKMLRKLRNQEVLSLAGTSAEWVGGNSSLSRHLLYAASRIVQEFSGSVGFDEGFQCLR